jgi:hypothetical protein
MNCAEFQGLLPEILDSGETPESKVHIHSCPECSDLYVELREISQAAVQLRAGEEPNQRVWNLIEIALRQEGLIRDTAWAGPTLLPTPARRWRGAWLAPIAALLLVMTSGIAVLQHVSQRQPLAALNQASTIEAGAAEDQELLNTIGERAPALRATYAVDLRSIDSYIHNAEDTLKSDPTDEEAQRALMGAYEQRAMVYELAFDRP